jgi:DNA-binding response OmpR family regulator
MLTVLSCQPRDLQRMDDDTDIEQERHPIKSTTVLVVDDDPKLASVLVRSLERAGYHCRVAHTGDEALQAVHDATPAAIVMDVMFPPPTGIEVCTSTRAGGFTGPIVMISAGSDPAARAAAKRAGATDFLAKPFPLVTLVGLLATALAPTL